MQQNRFRRASTSLGTSFPLQSQKDDSSSNLSWDKEATERGENVSPCSDDFNEAPAPVLLSLSAQFDTMLELSVIRRLMLPTQLSREPR